MNREGRRVLPLPLWCLFLSNLNFIREYVKDRVKFNIVTQIDGNFYWILELLQVFFTFFPTNYCYYYSSRESSIDPAE